jgi:hypothetical protein
VPGSRRRRPAIKVSSVTELCHRATPQWGPLHSVAGRPTFVGRRPFGVLREPRKSSKSGAYRDGSPTDGGCWQGALRRAHPGPHKPSYSRVPGEREGGRHKDRVKTPVKGARRGRTWLAELAGACGTRLARRLAGWLNGLDRERRGRLSRLPPAMLGAVSDIGTKQA